LGDSAKAWGLVQPAVSAVTRACSYDRAGLGFSDPSLWPVSAVAEMEALPAAYYSWGVALAKRGDLTGAQTKLKDANQRGPHWADPLKAWGDVLVKQGKMREALRKYDEALKYAPNWKQLKEAREAAGP
jgi:tetratricopeptide (TPR) repeat protein